MLGLAINTYVHILFVIVIIICLVIEYRGLRYEMKWEKLLSIFRVDGMYGLAAVVVATTGLLNWFYFGKGSDYYTSNTIFIIKFSLFNLVGLLSIYPTVWFFRYKKRHKANPPETIKISNVTRIKTFIAVELTIMAIIPLLATLMANGIGFW